MNFPYRKPIFRSKPTTTIFFIRELLPLPEKDWEYPVVKDFISSANYNVIFTIRIKKYYMSEYVNLK